MGHVHWFNRLSEREILFDVDEIVLLTNEELKKNRQDKLDHENLIVLVTTLMKRIPHVNTLLNVPHFGMIRKK